MALRNVTELLSQVQDNTQKYLSYFTSRNLPEPSYNEGDSLNPQETLPIDIISAKEAAIEATDELHHLLLGPLGLILSSPGDVSIFH